MFVSQQFQQYCINLIKNNIFPHLIANEFDFIMQLFIQLIDFIILRFNIDPNNIESFQTQLTQNNNRDLIAIFNMLLPFIDDRNGSYELHKLVFKLSDISTKKDKKLQRGFVKKTDNFKEDNISKNPYIISNRQFDKSYVMNSSADFESAMNKRGQDIFDLSNASDSDYFIEYTENIKDIRTNFILLLNTIDQISNKLYINWLNIRPITWDYVNSRLYRNTYKYDGNTFKFNGQEPVCDSTDMSRKYQGLSLGDIYNTIHHDLYFAVKNFKWLIYETNQGDMYLNVFMTYFQTLKPYLYENKDFSEVPTNIIGDFDVFKKRLKDDAVNDNHIYSIMYNVIYYIQRKYTKKEELKKTNYKPIFIQGEGEDDDDRIDELADKYAKIRTEDVGIAWDSLEPFYLYDYMRENLQKLRNTWYGYQILMRGYNKVVINGIAIDVSFKNVYNWAKSLLIYVHCPEQEEQENKVVRLAKYKNHTWAQLSCGDSPTPFGNQRDRFIDVFNKRNEDWFNISGILRGLGVPNANVNVVMAAIRENIYKNIIDISFECLIYRGTLNEFVMDPMVTNNYYDAPTRQNAVKSNIFSDSKVALYGECMYFLTNDKYKNLPPMIYKDRVINYFQFLKEQEWYGFYALDWISQINFYHRFINNRVILVTGATGTGKSLHVPKLLLYGLYAIDYNYNGKVVSTQPRITPTVKNSERISEEMGVMMKSYSRKFGGDVSNFMNYIQYKTSKNTHDDDNVPRFLKNVTDGTLVEDLYNNPLLKLKRQGKKKLDNVIDFTMTNKYDIVIIDESHEHNKNMDIILTLAKYTINMNNSLRLIIVSATMEEDEPIYRRFYRTIDDNTKYPFNFYNQMIGLNRNVIDRRIHISPPGETTKHKIIESYLPTETANYDEAERIGLETLAKIFRDYNEGDILFFTWGVNKIRFLVDYINKNSPGNIVALPFYAELPEKWKTIAESTENIGNLTINKLDILTEIELPGSGRLVSSGTYTRAIIIATNIAEASITIKNLKHVIDTGYYNLVTYDTVEDKATQKVERITEASRKQRKGRVGRRSSGWVWYMYAEGSREDVNAEYNICNTSISGEIFKMLYDGHETHLIPKQFLMEYMYRPDGKYDTFADKLTEFEGQGLEGYDNMLASSIGDLLVFQWLLHSNSMHYYVDCNTMALNVNSTPHHRFTTGYNYDSVMDFYGTFHIIHPAETKLKRHAMTGLFQISDYIANGMVDMVKTFIKKTVSPLVSLIYGKRLIAKREIMGMLMTDALVNGLVLENFYSYKSTNIRQFDEIRKSPFAMKLMDLYRELGLETLGVKDEKILLGCLHAIIYGEIYGIRDDIIKVVAMIVEFGIDPKGLMLTYVKDGVEKKDYRRDPRKRFMSRYGDLMMYHDILNTLCSDIPKACLIEKEEVRQTRDYEEVIKEYENFKANKSIDKWNNNTLDPMEYEILRRSDGKPNGKNMFKDYVRQQIKSNNMSMEKEIYKWSMMRYLDPNKVAKALRTYRKLKIMFEREKTEEIFEWFENNIKIQKINDNHAILRCFLNGFIRNVAVKINDDYVDMYVGDKVEMMGMHNYVMYLGKDRYGNAVNLNYIKLSWAHEIFPDFINPQTITRKEDKYTNYYVELNNVADAKVLTSIFQ